MLVKSKNVKFSMYNVKLLKEVFAVLTLKDNRPDWRKMLQEAKIPTNSCNARLRKLERKYYFLKII